MKYSFEWLKEYVSLRMPLERLAERLTLSGLEVLSTQKTEGDTILEIEITPNRPDLLSHLGLAREVAALTRQGMRSPRLRKFPSLKGRPLSVQVLDKKGCPRYTGRLFESIQVGSSPSWTSCLVT